MDIESGKFFGISNDEYHTGIGKVWESKSGLSNILTSPRNYIWEKEHPEDLAVFDQKAVKYHEGTAVHTYFLEPEKFDDEIFVMPEEKRRSKGTTEDVLASGKAPIKKAFFDEILEMEKSLESGFYERASGRLRAPDNFTEMSGFLVDPGTGIKIKARPDFISSDGIIFDLKTHGDIKPFFSAAIDKHYDMQAALALRIVSACTGVEHTQIGYIVVSKTPVYEWEVYIATPEYVESGVDKLDRALELLEKCRENNEWPGIKDEYRPLELPQWRRKQLENKK